MSALQSGATSFHHGRGSMGDSTELAGLIESAAAGDRSAVDRLLLREYGPLMALIRSQIPAGMGGRLSAEDLHQKALIRAAKAIKGFQSDENGGGFRAWLHTIARNVVRDAVKFHKRDRRDVRREIADLRPAASDDSMVGLLDLLPISAGTPSRSAARHEAVAAVRVALASIPDDYRRAIHLRYVEGLSVAETAERMGRGKGAIHMLCHRGLKAMAEAMGTASKFFTWKM